MERCFQTLVEPWSLPILIWKLILKRIHKSTVPHNPIENCVIFVNLLTDLGEAGLTQMHEVII